MTATRMTGWFLFFLAEKIQPFFVTRQGNQANEIAWITNIHQHSPGQVHGDHPQQPVIWVLDASWRDQSPGFSLMCPMSCSYFGTSQRLHSPLALHSKPSEFSSWSTPRRAPSSQLWLPKLKHHWDIATPKNKCRKVFPGWYTWCFLGRSDVFILFSIFFQGFQPVFSFLGCSSVSKHQSKHQEYPASVSNLPGNLPQRSPSLRRFFQAPVAPRDWHNLAPRAPVRSRVAISLTSRRARSGWLFTFEVEIGFSNTSQILKPHPQILKTVIYFYD